MNTDALFNPDSARFNGPDLKPSIDGARLTGQLNRVFQVMSAGHWLTLSQIRTAIIEKFEKHDPEASISAQLRNLRKTQFGSHTIDRENKGYGVFAYRLRTKHPTTLF